MLDAGRNVVCGHVVGWRGSDVTDNVGGVGGRAVDLCGVASGL